MKKIFSNITCIILTVILFIFSIISILIFTVFNKDYMLSFLDKNNYYDDMYELVIQNVNSYVMLLNQDNSFLSDVYTKDSIKNDIINTINSIYSGKKIKFDSFKLDDKFSTYYDNMVLTDKEREKVNTVKNDIYNSYKSDIVFSNSIYNKIGKILSLANKYKILILSVILIFIIILIFNKNLSSILFSTSFLLIIFKLLLFRKVHNILVINKVFSNMIINLIDDVLSILFIVSICYIIFSFFKIIISVVIKRKKLDRW